MGVPYSNIQDYIKWNAHHMSFDDDDIVAFSLPLYYNCSGKTSWDFTWDAKNCSLRDGLIISMENPELCLSLCETGPIGHIEPWTIFSINHEWGNGGDINFSKVYFLLCSWNVPIKNVNPNGSNQNGTVQNYLNGFQPLYKLTKQELMSTIGLNSEYSDKLEVYTRAEMLELFNN